MFVHFVELLIEAIHQFLTMILVFRVLKAKKPPEELEIKTFTLFNNYTYSMLQNCNAAKNVIYFIIYYILYFFKTNVIFFDFLSYIFSILIITYGYNFELCFHSS